MRKELITSEATVGSMCIPTSIRLKIAYCIYFPLNVLFQYLKYIIQRIKYMPYAYNASLIETYWLFLFNLFSYNCYLNFYLEKGWFTIFVFNEIIGYISLKRLSNTMNTFNMITNFLTEANSMHSKLCVE